MLPIMTSNEGLFDFLGGELTGAEGGEGAAPGAFLDLLSSMGAIATEHADLGNEANLGDEGDTLQDLAQLFAQPSLDPPRALLGSEEGHAEGTLATLGGDLAPATELAELGREAGESSLVIPEPSKPVLTQAQETKQEQALLLKSTGLEEAGQAIRALGGEASGSEEAQATSDAGSSTDAGPSTDAGSSLQGTEQALALESLGAERSLASELRSPDSSSTDASAASSPLEVDSPANPAESQGETASTGEGGEQGEEGQEALFGESGAEDPDLLLPDTEPSSPRSPEPERREGAATRGVQAQGPLSEVALPEFGEAASLEVEALEATSPLEAASEAGEVGGPDLIGQIEISIEPGQEEARIQLHPEELGRVDVRVRRREGRMVATLTVERPETTAEIEAHLPELRDALSERGIELDEVEVQTDASAFEFDSDHEGEGKERGDLAQERAQDERDMARRPKPKARRALSGTNSSTRAHGAALDTLA